jgi:hypothetical protein
MNQQLKGGDRVICMDPNHPRYHQSGILYMMTVLHPLGNETFITGMHWDGEKHPKGWNDAPTNLYEMP